tara:strand:- start:557 stop:688 length:132 start_codon:yes stop_codon:yes gene_type:complete
MKTNLILLISLIAVSFLFFMSEVISLKKEVKKINRKIDRLSRK